MSNFTLEEAVVDQTITVDLNTENEEDAIESFWEFSNGIGSGSFKKFVFNSIHLCFGELKLNQDRLIKIELPCPIVEMHFAIDGDSYVQNTQKNSIEIKFLRNQHNLIYYPKNDYSVGSETENSSSASFHVIFTEKHFLKILNKNFPILDSFLGSIETKDFAYLHPENMVITSEMNSILNELIHCKRKGVLKCLFTEAKILKLLMLQLEQFESAQTTDKNLSIKEYDIEKIHLAKSILEENISITPSLVDLAHKAGLNDFKLKKGFKEIYGTTVFGYLNEIRMNEAKKMLLSNELSTAEIALACGYKFVQNFSKAFKQKFGTTPEKFRKDAM